MATDSATSLHRNRAIFDNLLRQLPSADRDLHLARLADAYQAGIDAVLAAIDGAPPTSVRPKPKATIVKSKPIAIPEPPVDTPAPPPVAPAPAVEPHEHSATCGHLHDAVERANSATVPGAVRAVLTSESAGLTPRQIKEGVRMLRPETEDEEVDRAIYAMRQRGELAREGIHKNYRYRLVVPVTALGSGVVSMDGRGPGGEPTH